MYGDPLKPGFLIATVRSFFSAFRDRGIAASLVIASIATMMGIMASIFHDYVSPVLKTEHPVYDEQMKALDSTRASIQQLLAFVDEQKKQLQASQDAVTSLKAEESKLHPLVEADRKVIDAMFAAQEERNQTQQSKERWTGFGFGVASSLAASILLTMFSRFSKARQI